ncbi:hypothetical protein SH580_13745 [Coraliomargarita algicola]|uniref:Uncharacterized protein n=1 Tax=Coraliomargarita algicola TaxID=3092156 RepID=A0ABZ0RGY2_9BACT|nr:hypothetical protein [Coraliomargarita sp. J2-16]WPJ94494.1 hypothetical protein SH580_13745 [Coraliomargarita sp. J2-16]
MHPHKGLLIAKVSKSLRNNRSKSDHFEAVLHSLLALQMLQLHGFPTQATS